MINHNSHLWHDKTNMSAHKKFIALTCVRNWVYLLAPFTRHNCDSINFTSCLRNAASKANFGIFKDPE